MLGNINRSECGELVLELWNGYKKITMYFEYIHDIPCITYVKIPEETDFIEQGVLDRDLSLTQLYQWLQEA